MKPTCYINFTGGGMVEVAGKFDDVAMEIRMHRVR